MARPGAIIKTLTDIEDMARLTENSKYAILNDRGDIIKGKVPRDFVFYSRSGYSSTYYKDWVPYLKEIGAYARARGAHLIGSAGARDIDGWKDICRTFEDCGLPMVELNFGCPHPAMMPGVHGGSMIGQEGGRRLRGHPRGGRGLQHPDRRQADAGPVAAGRHRPGGPGRRRIGGHRATDRHTGFSVDIETGAPRIAGHRRHRRHLGQAADAALGAQHLHPGRHPRSPVPTASSTTAMRWSS